jgi:hypothetical protein
MQAVDSSSKKASCKRYAAIKATPTTRCYGDAESQGEDDAVVPGWVVEDGLRQCQMTLEPGQVCIGPSNTITAEEQQLHDGAYIPRSTVYCV